MAPLHFVDIEVRPIAQLLFDVGIHWVRQTPNAEGALSMQVLGCADELRLLRQSLEK